MKPALYFNPDSGTTLTCGQYGYLKAKARIDLSRWQPVVFQAAAEAEISRFRTVLEQLIGTTDPSALRIKADLMRLRALTPDEQTKLHAIETLLQGEST